MLRHSSFFALAQRLWPLYLSQALATGATTVSTILASLVMSGLQLESLSGLPATLISVSAALSASLFGALMLRRGRKLGLGLAFVLGGVGSFVGFLGGKLEVAALFLGGAALMGAAQGGFQQARYAAAESVPVPARGLALGVLMLMSVLGSFVMTGFGTQIAALGHTLGTGEEVTGWLVGGGLLLLAAGLIAVWRPVVAVPAKRSAAATAEAPPAQTVREAFRVPGVPSAALAFASAQAVMVTLMSLTPLRAHHLGMEHGSIATLVSGHIAGMFAFGLLTGPLIDRLGLRFGFAAGGALLLLAAATSVGGTHASLLLSMFVLGLGWNLTALASSKILSLTPAAQGPSDSLAFGLTAASTLLGGLLMARAGFDPLAMAAALLACTTFWAAWRAGRR